MDYKNSFWNSENVIEMYDLDNAENHILQPHIAKIINDKNPTKILDYGCGDAPLLNLLNSNIEITLFDKNTTNLRRVAKENKRKKVNIVESESEINDNEYDVVVLSLVLLCIGSKEEHKRILSKIYNSLKKGGTIILVITHPCFTHYDFGHYNTSQKDEDFNYFNEGVPYTVYMKREDKEPVTFTDYFWTLSHYINLLIETKYSLTNMIELKDEPYKKNNYNKNFSPFLILEAIK